MYGQLYGPKMFGHPFTIQVRTGGRCSKASRLPQPTRSETPQACGEHRGAAPSHRTTCGGVVLVSVKGNLESGKGEEV